MSPRAPRGERGSAGDEQDLEELAAEHRSGIYRTAHNILGDPDAAEDIAQEVLLRLHTALPGFRGEADLATWLYRITLNLCRTELRKDARRGRRLAEHPAASSVAPDDEAVDQSRLRERVRSAIERLPAEQKEALTLRYISDLPYREIARITGAPLGTVASRVFRALTRLGEELEPIHMEVIR